MNRYITKENMQIVNKHIKICSTSLAIRQTQIKSMMRYHNIPFRTAKYFLKLY